MTLAKTASWSHFTVAPGARREHALPYHPGTVTPDGCPVAFHAAVPPVLLPHALAGCGTIGTPLTVSPVLLGLTRVFPFTLAHRTIGRGTLAPCTVGHQGTQAPVFPGHVVAGVIHHGHVLVLFGAVTPASHTPLTDAPCILTPGTQQLPGLVVRDG